MTTPTPASPARRCAFFAGLVGLAIWLFGSQDVWNGVINPLHAVLALPTSLQSLWAGTAFGVMTFACCRACDCASRTPRELTTLNPEWKSNNDFTWSQEWASALAMSTPHTRRQMLQVLRQRQAHQKAVGHMLSALVIFVPFLFLATPDPVADAWLVPVLIGICLGSVMCWLCWMELSDPIDWVRSLETKDQDPSQG